MLLVARTTPESEASGPINLLLVDDSVGVRIELGDALRDRGLRVRVAENGLVAIAAALKRPPDIILSDVEMPVMDGWTFLRMTRARQRLHPSGLLHQEVRHRPDARYPPGGPVQHEVDVEEWTLDLAQRDQAVQQHEVQVAARHHPHAVTGGRHLGHQAVAAKAEAGLGDLGMQPLHGAQLAHAVRFAEQSRAAVRARGAHPERIGDDRPQVAEVQRL